MLAQRGPPGKSTGKNPGSSGKGEVTPPCEHCPGACCRMHGKTNQGVSLTSEEEKKPRFKEHIRNHRVLGKLLSFHKSGKCPFLDSSTFKCRIYEERPLKCREFTCIGIRPESMLAKTFPIVRGWIR